MGQPVWTGREVLFSAASGGASYDPVQDQWSRLPQVADRVREFWTATWTGQEMIVWGGSRAGSEGASSDGVAFAPE
jgi:hypothetical protein